MTSNLMPWPVQLSLTEGQVHDITQYAARVIIWNISGEGLYRSAL